MCSLQNRNVSACDDTRGQTETKRNYESPVIMYASIVYAIVPKDGSHFTGDVASDPG
jgi:hypothetical protein